MNKLFMVLVGAILSFNAYAEDFGTKDEAKAMVLKTIESIDAIGKEATYALVNDKEDPTFHDRDLYVFIISLDGKGTFIAHGAKPPLIGKDLIALKDIKGTPLVQNFVDMVEKNGEGWVDYYWPHPITKKTTAKTSFVKKYDDEIFVGVGVYK